MRATTERPFPIILAHGIARPDILIFSLLRRLNLATHPLLSDRFHYFRLIASHLRKHGIECYHSNVSFAADLVSRSKDLTAETKRILETSGHRQVHLIGHSMGGLDARRMIAEEGMEDRVASLTTIGTPHLGTSFADWGLAHGGSGLINIMEQLIDLDGFADLTTEACRNLNIQLQEAEARNKVQYATWSSWQRNDRILLPFQFSGNIIEEREGRNDGLVPYTSQRWVSRLVAGDGSEKAVQQFDYPLRADHFNQIGWWNIHQQHGRHWWKRLFRRRRVYELRIRTLYLEIARSVQQSQIDHPVL